MEPHISPGGGRRADHTGQRSSSAYLPRGGASHLLGRGQDHRLVPIDSTLPPGIQRRAGLDKTPPTQGSSAPLGGRFSLEPRPTEPRPRPLRILESYTLSQSCFGSQPELRPLSTTAEPLSLATPTKSRLHSKDSASSLETDSRSAQLCNHAPPRSGLDSDRAANTPMALCARAKIRSSIPVPESPYKTGRSTLSGVWGCLEETRSL